MYCSITLSLLQYFQKTFTNNFYKHLLRTIFTNILLNQSLEHIENFFIHAPNFYPKHGATADIFLIRSIFSFKNQKI